MKDDTMPRGVLQAFIPTNFLAEIKDYLKRNPQANSKDDCRQHIETFNENFDADIFENVFVKWDSSLRKKSKDEILKLCEAIFNKTEKQLT